MSNLIVCTMRAHMPAPGRTRLIMAALTALAMMYMPAAAVLAICFGEASAQADSFWTDSEIRQMREQQSFQYEMDRINRVGDRFTRQGQCFLKADREQRKMPVKKWKAMSEAEQVQFSKDIVNDCCLEHDCDGWQ